ncbi:MAG TPA: cytochrome D1 domain-containing protein [Steroidobacteraceae bacterium]|nr:cytochrome D1 domain-containing protein [Steroidobacteraceae bacterium]
MRTLLALLLSASALSAFAAGRGTLLVLNKAENTVSLIDLATKKSVATIPTGDEPHEIAVSPDGKVAVICNYGTSPTPGNTLTVIDIAARKSLRTIDLGKHVRPHGIAWLRGNHVAVTTEGTKTLLTVDIAASKVTAAIDTGELGSHMVALAPAHDRAFVANINSGSVSVIDLKQQRRVANITTGDGTEGIAISPDQREVWAGNRDGNTLSIIDVASLKVVATLPSKSFPIRLKFTADGKNVLVANAQSGAVAVWDAATRRELRRVDMQEPKQSQWGSPIGILVAAPLSQAFVATPNLDQVAVIDLATWQVVDWLTTGDEPDGLGYSQLAP